MSSHRYCVTKIAATHKDKGLKTSFFFTFLRLFTFSLLKFAAPLLFVVLSLKIITFEVNVNH